MLQALSASGQIDLINSIGKTVIVCPDRDKSGGNLIDVAVENNWLVSFPQWENNIKDCAEAVKANNANAPSSSNFLILT